MTDPYRRGRSPLVPVLLALLVLLVVVPLVLHLIAAAITLLVLIGLIYLAFRVAQGRDRPPRLRAPSARQQRIQAKRAARRLRDL